MNTDVEDLLREGMERFTSDLRAPAGLTRRVARRRRRRLGLRSAAGAATAAAAAAVAAAAVALVAVGLPGTSGPAVAAAAVVKRVDSALSAAEPGDIAQMTITTTAALTPGGRAVTTTAEEWSYRDQWRSVANSADGRPVYEEGFASSVYTLVNYGSQTWAREPGLGRAAGSQAGPASCWPVPAPAWAIPRLFQPGLPGIDFSVSSPPATAARNLRTAVSCGRLVVAGQGRVDGIDATELTSRPGSPILETIWVSPGTYLPVRVVIRSSLGVPAFRLTADITWLAPTAHNLARLTVHIPAGFRQVQLIAAVIRILARARGNPLQFEGGQILKTICVPTLAGDTCRPVPGPFPAGP
jgi:hypothetical protein